MLLINEEWNGKDWVGNNSFNVQSFNQYDLGTLARNVFYMICREKIMQPS